MYFYIAILLLAVLLPCLFFYRRRRSVCKRLRGMTCTEKLEQLSLLATPFGYRYDAAQDVFSTTLDAPQRAFGYTALYDRYAPHFGMVFDCMPVYFDYDGRTWLIEFWKGQYGINTGCEIGVYCADTLVAKTQRKTALFHSVNDGGMLPMSLRLFHCGTQLAYMRARHWWLTAFDMGHFSAPHELSVHALLSFPDAGMLAAFVSALATQTQAVYHVCGTHVQLCFSGCTSHTLPFFQKLARSVSLRCNRLYCRLFLWVTKPFSTSSDRLLFLYYFLPSIFRRIFRNKKRRKCCRKSCRKCRHRCMP